jgi:hypothetical protein
MSAINLSLQMGDIIRAWWPLDEAKNVPGNKLRPVIFLGFVLNDGVIHYLVAYGTSQIDKRQAKNGGDIIVRYLNEPKGVLNTDTLFDFNRIACVPANDHFVMTNKVGCLPSSQLEETAKCMHAAQVNKVIARNGAFFEM